MNLLIYSDSMVAQVQFSEYGESKVHPSSKLATEKKMLNTKIIGF